jgi:hypothetical protein
MALAAALCGTASSTMGAQAVRLSAGTSDTIVVNTRRAIALPVEALDAAGRTIAGARIRYSRAGGAPLPVTADGQVTCTRAGDVVVRAVLDRLVAAVVVRCRPVQYVRIPGPVQFILGDIAMSRPRALPIEAYAPDGRRVALLAGTARVLDGAVAGLRGLTVHPRARGITIADAHVGDASGAIGVHVYQRVDTLAALDTLLRLPPGQRLFAVPLRFEAGTFQRQRLPPGDWMLTMLPEDEDDPQGIKLRVEGAVCRPVLNTPRRFGCRAGPDAVVVVYRPTGEGVSTAATGHLLVRWLFTPREHPSRPLAAAGGTR